MNIKTDGGETALHKAAMVGRKVKYCLIMSICKMCFKALMADIFWLCKSGAKNRDYLTKLVLNASFFVFTY